MVGLLQVDFGQMILIFRPFIILANLYWKSGFFYFMNLPGYNNRGGVKIGI